MPAAPCSATTPAASSGPARNAALASASAHQASPATIVTDATPVAAEHDRVAAGRGPGAGAVHDNGRARGEVGEARGVAGGADGVEHRGVEPAAGGAPGARGAFDELEGLGRHDAGHAGSGVEAIQ